MPLGGDIVYASDWNNLVVPPPKSVAEPTNIAGLINTTASAQNPVCGVAFTAPQSGRVLISVQASLMMTAGTGGAYTLAGGMVRSGATLNTGGTVHDPSVGEPAGRISCGGGAGGLNANLMAGASIVHEGLTPGAAYNVVVVTWVLGGTGGTYTILTRAVLAVPLPLASS